MRCSQAFTLFFLLLSLSSTAQIPYGNNPAAGHYLEVKDARLYYEVYGTGEPLLLLHGGVFGYIDEFTTLIDRLSARYMVICLATRGHGRSGIGRSPFTWDQRADDACAVLSAVTKEPAVIIGFSDGAYTGYKLAARYPKVVKRLVAIGAGDRPKGKERKKVNHLPDSLLKQAGQLFQGRLKLMPEPDRWDECLQWLNRLYNEEFLSEETFPAIKCPTLVISGEKDHLHSPENIYQAAAYIRDSRYLIVPQCGHVVLGCRFEAVWQPLSVFLKFPEPPGHASFSRSIDRYATLLKIPAMAVGVARGGEIIYFKGYGAADRSGKEEITRHHIFPVASVTKSFTAAALKQLEDMGKLSLNDPISKFPNRYFNSNRWDSSITLAHLLSHTSESRPAGTRFVYNGSRFNIVFNAFSAINPPINGQPLTWPFTDVIQRQILDKLNMEHTLLKFDTAHHAQLKRWIVGQYRLEGSHYQPVDVELSQFESGPGYGMMSSVNDLVRYAHALDKNLLPAPDDYKQLTTPFYKGSPYGMGWFVTVYEGVTIHWAYGYGDNDSALLLKIPSMDLTLVILAASPLLSDIARFGYGSPFTSELVCSFFENFAGSRTKFSRLDIELKFARVMTQTFLPAGFGPDTIGRNKMLLELIRRYPSDPLWQTPAAFELLSTMTDRSIMEFAQKSARQFIDSEKVHPVKSWFAGLILEKTGKMEDAIRCYTPLAEGGAYPEQVYRFNAMQRLIGWYKKRDIVRCRRLLEDLIRYKEWINVEDSQYNDAIQMLQALKEGS